MKVGIKLCDNLDKRLGSFQFQTFGAQREITAPGKFTYNVTLRFGPIINNSNNITVNMYELRD